MSQTLAHLIEAAVDPNSLLSILVRSKFGHCILLLNPRASLLRVVFRAQSDRQLYCVFPSAKALRQAEITQAAPALLFCGSLQPLLAGLTLSPTLVWINEPDPGFALDEALAATYLPPGIPVLGAANSPLIASWLAPGLLEPQRLPFSAPFQCWATTRACKGRFPPLAPPLYQIARLALEKAHAGSTPANDAVVLAQAIEFSQPLSQQKRKEWPYSTPSTEPLPSTLPNGRPWPKISIITPSFQQGVYLEENILSVIHQQYPNYEHIVIDGRSTDTTPVVLAAYAPRLTYVVAEPDKGQANAVNKGMARATGEILTWLNSDDRLAPGALAAAALAFTHSGADLVAGICQILADGVIVEQHLTCCADGPLPLDDLLDLDGCWQAGQFFYQPEVFFTRAIWDKTGGGLREDMHHGLDYDLWVRCAEQGARLHTIGRPLAQFRRHDQQKTHLPDRFLVEVRRYLAERNSTPNVRPRNGDPSASPWKVAMLSDSDTRFGADIAEKRLAEALNSVRVAVSALTLLDPSNSDHTASLAAVVQQVGEFAPQLILLGSLHSLSPAPSAWLIKTLGRIAPVAIILHDLWFLTGRCAYPGTCQMYLTGCDHRCPTPTEYPVLAPEKIAGAWEDKRLAVAAAPSPLLLANSAWAQARFQAALDASGRTARPVERISLSVPLDTFRPRSRQAIRQLLGLPVDSFLILTSGDLSVPSQGLAQVFAMMALLRIPNATLLLLGDIEPTNPALPHDTVCLGHLADPERLALYFAAADVFVSGSNDETFGQLYIEAAASATPVVAFAGPGISEAVIDGSTGILVPSLSTASLADAVRQLYHSPAYARRLGAWARLYAENYCSAAFSFRSFLLALRRSGLLEQIHVSPRIYLSPLNPDSPSAVSPASLPASQGILHPTHNVGPQEGPIHEHALPEFRWAYGPSCSFTFVASTPGPHLLFVRYRGTIPGQAVTIHCNGETVAEEELHETGPTASALFTVEANLHAGLNEFTFAFKLWNQSSTDSRPLALIVEQTTVLRVPPPPPRMVS